MRTATLRSLAAAGLAFGLLLAHALAATPDTLAMADLVNHPDRWPPTVTLQRDYKFTNGVVAHQGEKVQVLHVDPTQVVVLTSSNVRFPVEPADCGILDAANAAWTALTPAQRAVDPESLAGDPALWPVQVTVATPITCSFGRLAAGTTVTLLSVTGRKASLCWPHSANRVSVDLASTDAVDRARRLVLVDVAQRPSRMAAALKGLLLDSGGHPYPDDQLEAKKYFAFYVGANWCAPCHAFSPDLVRFLEANQPKHPELQAVLLSNDPQVGPMLAYMQEEKMSFPAVPQTQLLQSTVLESYATRIIPHLVVVDRAGKILATNDDDHGNRGDPKDTLDALGKLLAAQ